MGYGTRSARIHSNSLDTLTFYNGEITSARRGSPVPQMECIGKPCAIYQPDAIQCSAVGRNGPDIEWKCQADLPSSIRFGRVEVSCEGYDSPDDPYILKGSCGLSYHLVRVDPKLEDPNYIPNTRSRVNTFSRNFMSNFCNYLTLALVVYMVYVVLIRPLMLYFSRNAPLGAQGGPGGHQPPPRPWFGGLGGWGGGGGPGGGNGGSGGNGGRPGGGGASPPPYSAKPDDATSSFTTSSNAAASGGSMWSDLGREMRRGAAFGAGTTAAEMSVRALFGGGQQRDREERIAPGWGGFGGRRAETAPAMQQRFASPFGAGGGSRNQDRGEGTSGTSGLGSMRTSSGFGGTRNR